MASKKILAVFLASTLFLSGCGQSVSEITSSVLPSTPSQFENQISHNNESFNAEQKIFDSLPENSTYFAFQNSKDIQDHIKGIANGFFDFVESDFPKGNDRDDILENKTLILSGLDQIKSVEWFQVFISYNGEKITKAEFPSFVKFEKEYLENKNSLTQEEQKELVEYLNTQFCIKASAKVDFPMLPVFFEQAQKMLPELKSNIPALKNVVIEISNPEEKKYTAQIGTCEGSLNLENISNINTFLVSSKGQILQSQEWKNKIDEGVLFFKDFIAEQELNLASEKDKDEFELGVKILSQFKTQYQKYNSVQSNKKTKSSLVAFTLGGDKIISKKIINIPSEREKNILKEKILGGALQVPFGQQDHIDYKFSLEERDDMLYFSDATSNIDTYYFPKKVLKSYMDLYTGGGDSSILPTIIVVGIIATGATAIYSGSQEKARDTVRINDINMLKSGLELYYVENNIYPDSLDKLLMTSPPVDPKSRAPYSYFVITGGEGYILKAKLESIRNGSSTYEIKGGKQNTLDN